MSYRKLVRPDISSTKKPDPRAGEDARRRPAGRRRQQAPSEYTHAEAYYYLKQMNSGATMVLTLTSGEILEGRIEWYDRHCIKLHRDDGPNLMLFKSSIKYLRKLDES